MSEAEERYEAAVGPSGHELEKKKKNITKRIKLWPPVKEWYGTILEIFKMEKLTLKV